MRIFRYLLPVVLACAAATTQAAESSVSLELNKLETVEGGCRMHVVVTNHTAKAFDKYVLDLVIFDAEGVIAKRTAIDMSPVKPSKTSVYAFNVKELGCKRFGRVLLNDVTGCAAGSGADASCTAGVSLSSKAGVEFFK
jgi:hypothetical protein